MRCVDRLYRRCTTTDRDGSVVLVHDSGAVLGDGETEWRFASEDEALSFAGRFGCEAAAYRCVAAGLGVGFAA
ncbi:MAG TPA: hypothetical protein VE990_00990 [Acidimicrobiales bacterium]|nr:hypothetical protein [Acidimicrobiales bacterium]